MLDQIKQQIKDECATSAGAPAWFYDAHLLEVERQAEFLLSKLPEADREAVMLGVWLHDLQRVRDIKGDHEEAGAAEAEKVLRQYDYSPETIAKVQSIILSHTCDKNQPASLEGRVLATADAMAHF